ncbi:MAG: FAD-dependent thymidylate synthase [Actinobacteria bacterium]|nr:FAD-dependent thymidylate synthase [Actinomycetota bacterium]
MHRTWSYNEISARYTELDEGYYTPETWRMQSDDNKQMSGGILPAWKAADSDQWYARSCQNALFAYHEMLEHGVSREMARMVLPLSTYTRFYGTVNLHNFLHFLSLREHEHAQPEIVVYAEAMRQLVEPHVPWTMEAYDA